MIFIKKKGFTLIELTIVIAIIGILIGITFPIISSYIKKAKTVADLQSLRVLNTITAVYLAQEPNPNPFKITTNSNDALMQVLVDNGFLEEKIKVNQKDISFSWNFSRAIWNLENVKSVLTHEQITMGTGWSSTFLTSYSGSAQNIIIPSMINDIIITDIYQDVFNDKNLKSVSFDSTGNLKRIHARAFKNNNLTEIELPDSIQRIDYGAFMDNDIVKIKIGSNVFLEGHVFRNNDSFKNIYYEYEQGAGTYVFTEGKWIKE